jgi:hypothetical protein
LREFALSKKMVSNPSVCDEVVLYTNVHASICAKLHTNTVAVCGQAAAAEETALHDAL